MGATILYVEDDANLGFVTKDNLELHNYEIVHCTDGKAAWEAFQKTHIDLCVLDVMLPEVDGFTLAKQIRSVDTHIPIIFLTARSLQEDKIHGLRLGGDDYLTKPFSIEELTLKIEVFLRRSNGIASKKRDSNEKLVTIGNYEFNFQKLLLASATQKHNLTYREAEVLKYLSERPNTVIRRDEMLKAIWGDDDYFMGRSLDVFISRLRKFLAGDSSLKIENIHSVGFRFCV